MFGDDDDDDDDGCCCSLKDDVIAIGLAKPGPLTGDARSDTC